MVINACICTIALVFLYHWPLLAPLMQSWQGDIKGSWAAMCAPRLVAATFLYFHRMYLCRVRYLTLYQLFPRFKDLRMAFGMNVMIVTGSPERPLVHTTFLPVPLQLYSCLCCDVLPLINVINTRFS